MPDRLLLTLFFLFAYWPLLAISVGVGVALRWLVGRRDI